VKVMWMGNIILPAIAEKESLPPVYIVGWLVGLSRRLTQLPDVALTYVFDAPKALTGEVDGYRYYGLVNPTRPTQRCGEAYTRQLEDILRKEQPDVIHLWGTENQHTLAMVDAAEHMGMRERIVISIQGLLSIYAEHYRAYLPEHVCHGHTLKDLVKGNIVRQEAIYRRVGQYEQEALRRVQHVLEHGAFVARRRAAHDVIMRQTNQLIPEAVAVHRPACNAHIHLRAEQVKIILRDGEIMPSGNAVCAGAPYICHNQPHDGSFLSPLFCIALL
jgi:hypothetical protein